MKKSIAHLLGLIALLSACSKENPESEIQGRIKILEVLPGNDDYLVILESHSGKYFQLSKFEGKIEFDFPISRCASSDIEDSAIASFENVKNHPNVSLPCESLIGDSAEPKVDQS